MRVSNEAQSKICSHCVLNLESMADVQKSKGWYGQMCGMVWS